jgi:type IV secretion system protein VirB4
VFSAADYIPIRSRLIDDAIPLEDHISDTAIVCKDGGIFGAFEVGGISPDTADDTDIGIWYDQLHAAWMNIHAEDIELKIYRCRSPMELAPYEGVRSPFARELDQAYRGNLSGHKLYRNSLFLLVHVHPPNTVQTVARFFGEAPTDPRASITERLGRLEEICGILETQLAIFRLRRLGYVERAGIVYDEIIEAIAFAATGVERPIPATTGRVGSAVFSEEISFKLWRTLKFIGAGEPYYGAIFTFKNYPTRVWPGMFYRFTASPYHSTLVHSYRFSSNALSEQVINRKQTKMMIGRDKAYEQREELKKASNDLLGRRCVLGEHSVLLLTFADDRQSLSKVANAAWRDLATCGLQALRLSASLRAAYLSILPGGARWRPRPGYVSSENFTAFEPFYNPPAGQETGHWPGPPIAIFRTPAGTPFPFHWHTGEVGNTLVTGMTGAGKTTMVAALMAWTADRARIVALDHKRGWEFLFRRMGGDYMVLGGSRPCFAPLKALKNTPQDIEFLIDLYRGEIGGVMTEEEQRRLSLGIQTIMRLPVTKRSVGELRAFFDDNPEGAGARLDKWCWGSELGWVTDAPNDTMRFGRLSGLDTTDLLDNVRASGPALAYIAYRISQELDGSPMGIFGDEIWRALTVPVFSALIEKSLRTIRSKNGLLVLISQSPGDFVNSGISRILTEMCPNQIHAANPRGKREDYVDGLGLTEGQFEALQGFKLGQGLYLIVQEGRGVVAQLPLHGLDQLRELAAREEDLRSSDVEFEEAAE